MKYCVSMGGMEEIPIFGSTSIKFPSLILVLALVGWNNDVEEKNR
jgi:hypothetical protein